MALLGLYLIGGHPPRGGRPGQGPPPRRHRPGVGRPGAGTATLAPNTADGRPGRRRLLEAVLGVGGSGAPPAAPGRPGRPLLPGLLRHGGHARRPGRRPGDLRLLRPARHPAHPDPRGARPSCWPPPHWPWRSGRRRTRRSVPCWPSSPGTGSPSCCPARSVRGSPCSHSRPWPHSRARAASSDRRDADR